MKHTGRCYCGEPLSNSQDPWIRRFCAIAGNVGTYREVLQIHLSWSQKTLFNGPKANQVFLREVT